jgi:LytS/YehU family sensor histidine kinase
MDNLALTLAMPPILWLAPLLLGVTTLGGMLWHARKALRRAQEAEAMVRHELLASRVHPHFLLNVLTALRATVERRPSDAVELLDDLADLLHARLRLRLDEPIALADELCLVRQYLRMEQHRFAENLVATVVADDVALECPIPPFSLLTLVENAMSHGGVDARGRRHVSVHVSASSSAITANVRNRPASGARTSHHSGLGLKMIRDRLRCWDANAHGPLLTYSPDWVNCAIVIPRARHPRLRSASAARSTDWAIG